MDEKEIDREKENNLKTDQKLGVDQSTMDQKTGRDQKDQKNQKNQRTSGNEEELRMMQEQRRQIRKEMKHQRAELSEAERKAKDRAITENLLAVLNFPDHFPEHFLDHSDVMVYAYASFGTEANTFLLLEALWRRKIPTALPRVEGNEMKFYLVSGREDLTEGYMGILEPAEDCLPAQSPRAVVITPGLAFTKDGKRLGYGGGFYDRFFEAEPLHRKVAIAYGFQVVRDLPSQPWDVRVDQLVTDEEIITVRNCSVPSQLRAKIH